MSPSPSKATSRGTKALWWLVCAAMSGCEASGTPDSSDTSEVASQAFAIDLDYREDEMFGFSIEQFCKDNAAHLLPYAEAISHVAGENRISPRALIALMEQQSKAVSNPRFSSAKPFGDLSKSSDFLAQLRDVSKRLRAADHSSDLLLVVDAPDEAILAVLPEQDVRELGTVFQTLFPGIVGQPKLVEKATSAQIPMQFPWAVGQSWQFGGAHVDNSASTYSSLDFTQKWTHWGDTINVNVVASAAGRVKKNSNCWLMIVHENGWSTGYYHLSNIMVADGAYVQANQPIAKYANNESQALCSGGDSGSPHVHWSLYSSNREVSLMGKELSGWTIHTGTSNYDENCSRMYLTKNGNKVCVGTAVRNDGISGDPTPTPQAQTLKATSDSYVSSSATTSNYGTLTTMRVGTSPGTAQALLKFSVPTLTGTVKSAKLRFYVTDATTNGPKIYNKSTSSSWSETSVNWSTRPSVAGSAIADVGSAAAGWVEVNLSNAASIISGERYTLIMVPDSSDAMVVRSRESGSAAELVIVTN